jgi:hypothetical protein
MDSQDALENATVIYWRCVEPTEYLDQLVQICVHAVQRTKCACWLVVDNCAWPDLLPAKKLEFFLLTIYHAMYAQAYRQGCPFLPITIVFQRECAPSLLEKLSSRVDCVCVDEKGTLFWAP